MRPASRQGLRRRHQVRLHLGRAQVMDTWRCVLNTLNQRLCNPGGFNGANARGQQLAHYPRHGQPQDLAPARGLAQRGAIARQERRPSKYRMRNPHRRHIALHQALDPVVKRTRACVGAQCANNT